MFILKKINTDSQTGREIRYIVLTPLCLLFFFVLMKECHTKITYRLGQFHKKKCLLNLFIYFFLIWRGCNIFFLQFQLDRDKR